MGGPEFNKDGTKMFVSYHNIVNKVASGADDFIAEYTLSTPFDISTATYAGDSERLQLTQIMITLCLPAIMQQQSQ